MADQITRDQIVEAARSFIGTPWVHQGRRADVAIDCIGLMVCAAHKAGLSFEDYTAYGLRPDGVTLMRELRKRLVEKSTDDLKPGDIVVFWISNRNLPQHIAVFTHNEKFIGDEYVEHGVGLVHALRAWETVSEVPIDERWRKRMHAAFEFPGVID